MDEQTIKPPKRLYDLEAAEISLVKKGANRRRFLITKSARSKMPAAHKVDLQELIAKTDPSVMQKVEERLKAYGCADGEVAKEGAAEAESGLSSQAHAAVKAVVRILSPFKDELSPLLLHQVLDDAGYELAESDTAEHEESETAEEESAEHEGDAMGHKEAAFQALPAKVESEHEDALPIGKGKRGLEGEDAAMIKKEHYRAAAEAGDKAYKEHLAKLGYEKYPPAEMAMKSLYDEDKEDELEDEDKDTKEAKRGEAVAKSSSSPDLSRLDPKTRASVEAVFKTNRDLIQKTADLEKRLTDRDLRDRKREIVAKAAGYDRVGLPQDDIVAMLEDADKAGSAAYERVCKNFDALNSQARSSALFAEFGTSAQSAGGGDGWSKIEALASGLVQKSDTKLTHAEAMDRVLKTPEGQRLYSEYKAGRKDGI